MPANTYRINSGESNLIEMSLDLDTNHSIQDDLNVNYLNTNISSLIGTPKNFEKIDYNFKSPELVFDLYFFQDIIDSENCDFFSFVDKTKWTDTYYSELYNKVGSHTNLEKSKITLPSFYNSFGYLYSDPNSLYGNNFTRQSFFYDSFIRVDFYTSPDYTTRKRIFTKLIYNNRRYLGLELGVNEKEQPRSTYILNEECDGFVINWLKETPITELYAIYSYYNSFPASGRTSSKRINLIPTPKDKNTKNKWLVNANEMHPEEVYVKYILNPEAKTYELKLYNVNNLDYTISTDKIDLFEFKTDAYWAKYNGYIGLDRDLSKAPKVNALDNFSFSSDQITLYKYIPGSTSIFNYALNKLLGNALSVPAYSQGLSTKQKLTNQGKSTLRLISITVSEQGDDKLSKIGYSSNTKASINFKNEQNCGTETYLFFDAQNLYLSSLKTKYGDSKLAEFGLVSPTKNVVTEENASDPFYQHEYGTKVSITYPKNIKYELKPNESLDLSFDLTVGARAISAFVPNRFKNTLFYGMLLVTVKMQDTVAKDYISKSFLINFRMVIGRDTYKDKTETKTTRSYADNAEYNNDNYYNYYNYYDFSGNNNTYTHNYTTTYTTTTCQTHRYWNGFNYTSTYLGNELFSYINLSGITPPSDHCEVSGDKTYGTKDYIRDKISNGGRRSID